MYIPRNAISITHELNRTWLKIFYHNSTNGKKFYKQYRNEMEYINEEDRFSILGLITDDFKVENGYYEFLLKYPEHPGGFNHWQQKVFPLTAEVNTDIGYHRCDGCNITWDGMTWNGLANSNRTDQTFIDGCNNKKYWWYAIGAMQAHNSNESLQFPGPASDNEGYRVYSVYLYLRITDEMLSKLLLKTIGTHYIQRILPVIFIPFIGKGK